MKNILNKTSIYSCTFAFLSILLGVGVANLARDVSRYWFNDAPEFMLVPYLTNWICEHPLLFPLFFMLIFIATALLAVKKGLSREIAFHAMMIAIIAEMFYLFAVAMAFALPAISVIMEKELGLG